jgi:hypothetical protein
LRAGYCRPLPSLPMADSSLPQVPIEFLRSPITVVQFLFTILTCLFHENAIV